MSWRDRRLPRSLPKTATKWPVNATALGIERIKQMYKEGFAGAFPDPEAREELFSGMAEPDGDDIAMRYGMAETGKGKLSLPILLIANQYPKLFPSLPQKTGNCVGKSGKNATLQLLGVEAHLAQPDEVTGEIEGFPEVPLELQPHGIVCWEHLYGERGHVGQGASCSKLILVTTKKSGAILRKNYPEVGYDFTKENTDLSIRWGRTGTPDEVLKLGLNHQIRNAADVNDYNVARDFCANGYPLWACSSLGFSDKRDANGYSRTEGSWNHSWIIGGYDDRPEIVSLYGYPLALFVHDWGRWNSGGRQVLGTDLLIPEGSMWIDARLLNKCDLTALSGLRGWKRNTLPTWGTEDVLG